MTSFALTRPCADCPFRSDKPFHLRPARARGIADSLLSDNSFPCHKTVKYADDDECNVETYDASDSQHCAGALIILERLGKPNQLMRIGSRLGMYDPARLDMNVPVYRDFDDFVHALEALDRSISQPDTTQGEP